MNPKKTPLALVPLWAVREIASVFAEGVKNGRKPLDWCDRPWNLETALEYRSALLRHLQEAEETINTRDCLRALASVCANAIILMYHEPHRIAAEHGYAGEELLIDNRTDYEKRIDARREAVERKPTQEELEKILDQPMDKTKVEVIKTDRVQEVPLTEPDTTWHRLNGWIALPDFDNKAHFYDGPRNPLCNQAQEIPKGAIRNLYNDPVEADAACAECARRLVKRKEQEK